MPNIAESDSITGRCTRFRMWRWAERRWIKYLQFVPLQRLGKRHDGRSGYSWDMADAVRRFLRHWCARDYGGIGGFEKFPFKIGTQPCNWFMMGVAVSDCQSAGQIDITFSLDNVSLSLSDYWSEWRYIQSARLYLLLAFWIFRLLVPIFWRMKMQMLFQVKGGSFGLVNPISNMDNSDRINGSLSFCWRRLLRSDGQLSFCWKWKYTQTEKK